MDEQVWLTSSRPRPLLAQLARWDARLKRPISERKLRFFAYHCCRVAWPTIRDERSRTAIDLAERAMVGGISEEERAYSVLQARLACEEAYAVANEPHSREIYNAAQGAAIVIRALIHGHTQSSVAKVRDALLFHGSLTDRGSTQTVLARMTHALRDICGNPFRPVAVDPAWLTSDVLALARGIYDERAFDRMPILADALQDAGCNNDAVLNHCRGGDAHVRGCWVVDLLLGMG